jgi:tetratricopeptide (TPR) repeat protein
MLLKKHLLPLLAALLLAHATVMADETDPARRTAVESGKVEAARLLKKGKAAEAYEIYMRLLYVSPDDDEIDFGLAQAAMASARYNQAVMAYERLLEKYPDTPALYRELAHAYMALNDRPSAERALAKMQALDKGTSLEEIETFLAKQEARYDRLQIHGKVRMGVLYDTNANLGPPSSTMNLGLWQVMLEDARAKNSAGGYLGASVDIAWRPERDTNWWLVGDVQGPARGNANNELNEGRNRYSEWGRVALGIRHLTPTTLFDLRFKSEVFDYEFYQRVVAAGPETTFLWAVSPSLHFITRATLDRRVYSRDAPRNGYYGTVGQYARIFFDEARHELLIGASYLGAGTDRTRYGYNGWEGLVRVTFKLPGNIEFSPYVAYSEEWYKGPATALETSSRYDEKHRVGASLTYRITDDWSAELIFQHTTNQSKSNLYDYNQNLISMGLAWNF